MVKVETLETNLPRSGDEGEDIFENLFDNAALFIKVELENTIDVSPTKTRNDPLVRPNDNIVFSHPTIDAFLCQQCGQSIYFDRLTIQTTFISFILRLHMYWQAFISS